MGTAFEITPDDWKQSPFADPKKVEAACIHHILHLPEAGCLWTDYGLFGVDLTTDFGGPPPKLKTPDAIFEILFVALDPGPEPYVRWTKERVLKDGVRHLEPVNYVVQLRNVKKEHVNILLHDLAKAVCDGVLPIEPADNGLMRPTWDNSIAMTLDHIIHGVHTAIGRDILKYFICR